MVRSISPKRALTRSGLLATAAVALALLGGCGNIPENLVPAPRPLPTAQPTRADWVEAQHQVPFATNDARLSPAATADIDGFLRQMDIGAGDRVAVSAETLGAPTTTRTLADRRRAAVLKYLRDRDIPAVAADMVATADNANVAIRIGRYVAKVPECAEWQRLNVGPGGYVDSGYKKPGAFGCMTYTALGNMVADPGDLAGRDQVGPADGTWMASSMRRYRGGQVMSQDNKIGGPGSAGKAPSPPVQ
ncbi:MAG: CpaD family pilus assembly lipoprotein [Candidatus Eiseniibacteriota bacterium]